MNANRVHPVHSGYGGHGSRYMFQQETCSESAKNNVGLSNALAVAWLLLIPLFAVTYFSGGGVEQCLSKVLQLQSADSKCCFSEI